MPAAHVFSFDDLASVTPTVEAAAPERVLGGDPVTKVWLLSERADGKVFTGIWASNLHHVTVNQRGETEYCHILEGRVRLTDEAGNVSTFGPGQAFVLAPDFVGEWESIEPVRKHFVLCLP